MNYVKLKDFIIGFVLLIIMLILFSPTMLLADYLDLYIAKMSPGTYAFIITVIIFSVLGILELIERKRIREGFYRGSAPDDDVCGNNNIKRNFYDYM